MKRLKKLTVIALGLLMAVTSVNLASIDVFAGLSNVVVDNTSFAEELDSSKWHAASADVLVEGGKLVFTSESTGRERTASVEKNVQQWQKYRRRGR